MSAEFQEIGIRITPETVAATEVGPLVITQDFAAEGTSRDAYVLGTVFDDGNGNDRYDNGEGLPNITLTFVDETGSSSTTSLSAGGYQIALPPGVYTATAAGTGLPVPIQVDGIVVEGQNGIAGGVFQNFNVKVDFNADDIPTLSVEVDAPAVAENAGNSATTAVDRRTRGYAVQQRYQQDHGAHQRGDLGRIGNLQLVRVECRRRCTIDRRHNHQHRRVGYQPYSGQ